MHNTMTMKTRGHRSTGAHRVRSYAAPRPIAAPLPSEPLPLQFAIYALDRADCGFVAFIDNRI